MPKVFTSRDGEPDEFIGELPEHVAVKFCFDNWTDRPQGGVRPPFEIVREDGSLFPWDDGSDDEDEDDDDEDDQASDAVVLDETVTCQRCQSHRVAEAGGKCSDMGYFSLGSIDHDGYVPEGVGIGGGDDIEITFCLDCGQMQGKWPLPLSAIEQGEEE